MRLQTLLAGWVLLPGLIFLGAVGCNSQNSADEQAALDVPDWLANDDGGQRPSRGRSPTTDDASDDADEAATDDPLAQSPDSGIADAPAREPRGELKLQLRRDEQFPLKKQVVTTLVQTAADGTQQRIQTTLQLLMAIQVEDVTEDRTRLGVTYRKVDYEQEIDGQKLSYRSSNPPATIPIEAQAYHDMVNDGFAFWIGKDNQINEVVGFQDFLQRCLANVPPAMQKQVLLGMEAGSDENGISDFVDNTIGLLPFGQEVTPGQEWVRHRNVGRPIPMVMQNRYTLQELNRSEAVVRISGEIIPSATINKVSHTREGEVSVTVLGGQTSGQCTIFRDTGLPKDSFTERVVNMTVDLGSGNVFDQTKTVTTRVEAFPEARAP